MHVKAADLAIRLGGSSLADSYLNYERIIEAARLAGADAIHPGYGFLSEDYRFAEACDDSGLVFIGPPAQAIRVMGLKSSARKAARAAGVSPVPGYDDDNQETSCLVDQCIRIGFPVMIKASAGGGGKAMRLVQHRDALEEAIDAARREALSAFGDGSLLIEKYIERARHIEIQILADSHGNIVHLFERDCSLQRRHQKVIEECPAAGLNPELRDRLYHSALAIASSIDYRNAGTIEFLVSPSSSFYFLEMNTRLQVEHPVTEETTGVDLVRLQIEIAEGRKLPFSQDDLRLKGAAIEARIYAESPSSGFLPSTGRIRTLRLPGALSDIRVEAGIEPGTEVPIQYDPLLAKVIARGADRDSALRKLEQALGETRITGVETNRDFLLKLLRHKAVIAGDVDTELITRNVSDLVVPIVEGARELAATVAALYLQQCWRENDPRLRHLPASYRNNPFREPSMKLAFEGEELEVQWREVGPATYEVNVNSHFLAVRLLEWGQGRAALEIDGVYRRYDIDITEEEDLVEIASSAGIWRVRRSKRFPEPEGSGSRESANAPMPGQVLKILVTQGQHVKTGEPLVILEAMKMEQIIRASTSGVVSAVVVKCGDLVSPGDLLIHIDADREE